MAIKILQKGRLPEEIEYKFTCQRCSTVFVATQLDGERVSNQHDGTYINVSCPTCGTSCSSSVEYKESSDGYKMEYPYGVRATISSQFQDFYDDRTMMPRFGD